MDVDGAHRCVLETIAGALPLRIDGSPPCQVERVGISDLALRTSGSRLSDRWKVSGNSLRMKQSHFLYHGTLLYDFDLPRIGRCLKMPSRMPDYRQARPHDRFVENLNLSRCQLESALIKAWQAEAPLEDWPRAQTARLVREKYSNLDWTYRGRLSAVRR